MIQDELLTWLQNWYKSCCNGDWEHSYSIKIENLDNPGWSVEIPLADTNCDEMYFEPIRMSLSDVDWYHVRIMRKEDEMSKEIVLVFKGSGGAGNLGDILGIFRDKCIEELKKRKLY